MARPKKVRYQAIRNIVLGALVLIMLGAILSSIAQGVIMFMLTGRIPGTSFVIPVWGMFMLYTGIAGSIAFSYYLDRELENQYKQKLNNNHLPRRRFSHI